MYVCVHEYVNVYTRSIHTSSPIKECPWPSLTNGVKGSG